MFLPRGRKNIEKEGREGIGVVVFYCSSLHHLISPLPFFISFQVSLETFLQACAFNLLLIWQE
jgi:hypothetical protein